MPKPVSLQSVRLRDHIGALADRVIDRWLLTVRETNPAILSMLRAKNQRPSRYLLPWSGEFAGKHLTSCAYLYRLTQRSELLDECRAFLAELLECQEPNGYIGPFPESLQLTGRSPAQADCDMEREPFETWDAWGHYHIMTGLLCWYDITGDPALFEAVERTAGLFLRSFYGDTGRRLVDIGSTEMNLAPYHLFAQLYNRTHNPEYLRFARELERDCADERAGNYLHYAKQNLPFYQCPKPRWESLHIVMGIAEMSDATGDRSYLDAAMQIFFSILETDVHNTGGFSTREQAVGHPYGLDPIETCCVVAYDVLAAELYKKTGDRRLVEFLEWSLYNAVAGSFSKSGRWSTYNTPMDGHRRANYDEINFQCRPGSPDLNCCSVNAPRGLGLLADWACVNEEDGALLLNYYGAGEWVTREGDRITVAGNALADGAVRVDIVCRDSDRRVRLRVPSWAHEPQALVNGQTADCADEILEICGSAHVELALHPQAAFEQGAQDCAGKTSVRFGPILFGADADENPGFDIRRLPELDRRAVAAAKPEPGRDGSLRLRIPVGEGAAVVLTDFYTLGQTGALYKTWLPISGPDFSACGIDCAVCSVAQTQDCPGCRQAEGHIFWGDCDLYACSRREKADHCGLCEQFPCAMLREWSAQEHDCRIDNLQALRQSKE